MSTPTAAQIQANLNTIKANEQRIAELEAMVKAAKAEARATIQFKVSEKGAISVYGLGRFPVTLYRDQWTKLMGSGAALAKFIQDNEAALSVKAPKA
jgi:hypothetical protein